MAVALVASAWPPAMWWAQHQWLPSPASPQVTEVRMVVVLLSAILRTPCHTLVLLSPLGAQPLQDPWVLLFCRTCVYTNSPISPINPITYCLTSQNSRAVMRVPRRGALRRPACLTTTSHGGV
ncbi:thyrotropin-releasing hormone receptor 3-like protein [Camelus ferus]|nr:thyrotropin-releasing hormone receptor 3-like protein [Camelus ferus]